MRNGAYPCSTMLDDQGRTETEAHTLSQQKTLK